jgi:hypothetical protein
MTLAGDHISDSVEAGIVALEQLAESLRQGGFAEGAAAYQRMVDVLVAQRLLHERIDDPLTARFEHVGEIARQVFELLEPYATAMRRLATMAPERPDDQAMASIRSQLERRGSRGATASVLSRAARLPRATVDRLLAALVADGTVLCRNTGDVESYRLAAQATTAGRGAP